MSPSTFLHTDSNLTHTNSHDLTPTRREEFWEGDTDNPSQQQHYPASDMSAMSSVASVDAISIGSSQDEDESYVSGLESSSPGAPAKRYVKSTQSSIPSILSSQPSARVDARSNISFHGLVTNPNDGMLSPPLQMSPTRHSIASSGTRVDSSDSHNLWSRPVPTSEFTIPHVCFLL